MPIYSIRNIASLGLVLASGLAFPLSTFAVRLLDPAKLIAVIDFQSTSVFLAFVLQMGFRAGLRNEYHRGLRRISESTESSLRVIALGVAFGIGGLSLLQDDVAIFPAFATALAMMTLIVGFNIAKKDHRSAASWSLATCAVISSAVMLVLYIDHSLVEMRAPIEALGIMVIVMAVMVRKDRHFVPRLVWLVMRRNWNVQIAAFVTYASALLVAQLAVDLAQKDSTIAIAFADAQIFCGLHLLLFSKGMMFAEGWVIRNAKVPQLCLATILWGVLWTIALALFGAYVIAPSAWVFYGALGAAIFGRIPYALLGQFTKGIHQRRLIVWGATSQALLTVSFSGSVQAGTASLILVGTSLGAVAAIFLASIRHHGGSAFIAKREAVPSERTAVVP